MKRFSEQLHKKSQTVKLRAAERRDLRERLVSYIEYHPLPKGKRSTRKHNDVQLFTEPFTSVAVPFQGLLRWGSAFAVLLLVLVPVLAERAVPGDPLYAVKVRFNEELRGTLTFDSYQKVEWETARLNRRIAEARLLASEGRLTEEVEAEVAAAVKVHTENAKREIEELRTTDADEAAIASIELETTLAVQATSLKEDETVDEEEPANLLADAIDESREDTAAENASSTVPAFDKVMARVEQNTTRIYELFNSLQDTAADTELADIERRLSDIERAAGEAIALRAEDAAQAEEALVAVLQDTQKLIVFMTELEVKNNIDIEELLPIVLTDEEEQALRAERNETLATKVNNIETLATRLEDDSVLEKTATALVTIEALQAEMAELPEDFTAFQLKANEAHALADDMLLVLQQLVQLPDIDPAGETATGTAETASSTEGIGESASSTEEIVPEIPLPLEEELSTTTEETATSTATTTEETAI